MPAVILRESFTSPLLAFAGCFQAASYRDVSA